MLASQSQVWFVDSGSDTFIRRLKPFLLSNHTECVTGTNFAQWTVNINCPITVSETNRFTGGPSGLRQTEPPHTDADLSPLSILTTSQRNQAPSMSKLNSLDTRHSRHWLKQCKRIRCCVCTAKSKETRTKFKC